MIWSSHEGPIITAEPGRSGVEERRVSAPRRSLTFASLDEVMPEVERLLLGHTTVGNWSLGQICSHLAQGIRFTLDGFPSEARLPWIIRTTIGRFILWRILRVGRFVRRMRMPAKYEPPSGADARVEAESLRAALERFKVHTCPLAEHPLKGQVSRAVWEQFHCIHCAHHLGFAVPVHDRK
jgi:hypothetical protein